MDKIIRKNKRVINFAMILIALMLSSFNIKAENTNTLTSFEGRRFYVAFMQNEIKFTSRPDEPTALHLFLSSGDTTNVSIQFLGQAYELTLMPNIISKYTFKREMILSKSEIPERKAIYIEADNPITVCGINSIAASSDMFSAIPTQNWGMEYVIMSYPNDTYVNKDEADYDVPRRSQFCVLSKENNTNVTITPTVRTAEGKSARSPFTVILNKGETYLVQSENVEIGGDLTGTLVTSDKPVGVICGHVRTAILQKLDAVFDTKDHLVEMLLPVRSWGKRFVTMPFLLFANKQDGNLFRVVSREPGTHLTITDENGIVREHTLNGINSFLEIDDLHSAAVWESSKPIQIMQYMKHNGSNDNIYYDPSMTLIPPTEQFVKKILVPVPDNSKELSVITQYEKHYAMLVMEKKAVKSMKLDGLNINAIPELEIKNIPNTEYCWARFKVDTGSHLFTSETGRFSGILYGFGKNDSYSVVLGSSALPVKMRDTIPPVINAQAICGRVDGYAIEPIDTLVNSGLDNIYIDKRFTQNYTFSLAPMEDTSTVVRFSARVKDESRDATILIYARDRSGNLTSFSYTYNAITTAFSHPDTIVNSMDWKTTKCIHPMKFRNTSTAPIVVHSIKSNNPKVSFIHNLTFPLTIGIKGEIEYGICFKPEDDYSDIEADITFELDCEKTAKYKAIMQVNACEIAYNEELDFSNVFIGKDKTMSVEVTNIGKNAINITGLKSKSPITGMFDFASVNTFPITIEPGAKQVINFKFTPAEMNVYEELFEIEYDCKANAQIKVIGKGISSELSDLTHDFGAVRLGNKQEYTFTLKNNGNTPAPIKFKSIETNDESFNIDAFKKLDITLQPGESTTIPVSFSPKSEGEKHLKAFYSLNLANEITYSLELKGKGVIPKIEVNDHALGTLYIYDSKDTILPVAKSTGSQKLLIQKVVAEGGNLSSFEYDLTKLTNISVEAGGTLNMPIKFKPTFIGEHKVQFAVYHDADSDVQRFSVVGHCIPYDTLSRKIEFSLVDSDNPCSEVTVKCRISNRGNVSTTVNSITVTKADKIKGELKHNISFPLTMKPSESTEFDYTFINDFDTEEDINFVFNFDDNEEKVETYRYKPTYTMKNLVLKKMDNLKFAPGDTISLEFSGSFPHTSHLPVTSYLRIHADERVIKLIPGTYSLELIKKSEKMQKELVLFTKNSYFDVPLISTLDFKDSEIQWKIVLRFVTYFKSERYHNIAYEFVSDKCFNSVADSLVTEMIEVCNHEQRDIQLVTLPNLKSYFVRDNNSLVLEFENYLEEQKLDIEIYDLNAQLIRRIDSILPQIGKNNIALDLSEIPDGVYFYKIKGLFIKENNKFIK